MLTRRKFLRSTTLAAGTLAGSLLLDACGQKKPAAPANPAAETSAVPAKLTETVPPEPAAQTSNVLGVGKGIFPGRVVWAHNPKATAWDGKSGFWWAESFTDQKLVDEMLSNALRQLTGKSDDAAAWDALFGYFKKQHGQSGGYQPGEKVAIKINLNGSSGHSGLKNNNFTSPYTLFSVLNQLVKAGVKPADISVYDASRSLPDPILDVCQVDGLAGLHFVDFAGGDGREACQKDLRQPVQWSVDVQGNPAYLPTLVTGATYLINISSLKGHSLAGVTLTAKNHFGTLISDQDGKPSKNPPQAANLHGYIAAHDYDAGTGWKWPQAPMGGYSPLVDLVGHPHLGGKTLLFMLDALYGVEEQNADVSNKSRFQSAPFNDYWPSSLFLSQDPVAIDSVGSDILANEPIITAQANVMPKNSTYQNYLHEAAQANQPTSKTDYKLASLGVHDHWNNPTERKYSRNSGASEGIELVTLF
jgi:hypothetical protein